MLVTDGMTDQDLLKVHVAESYRTIAWLHSKGHDWVPSYEDATTGNIVHCEGMGYGLQERNFAICERDDAVTIHYQTSAQELLRDGRGAISGVAAATPGGLTTFRAKAVVLSSGGFEANPEMRARYLGQHWDNVYNRGVPFNTGDGLRMALEVGAMPYGGWGSCHASPNDWAIRPTRSRPASAAGPCRGCVTSTPIRSWSIPTESVSSTRRTTSVPSPTPRWADRSSSSPAARPSRSSTRRFATSVWSRGVRERHGLQGQLSHRPGEGDRR